MKIELAKIKVSDLFDGYVDNEEEGVRGFHGLLNIRPPYQREFVYKDAQRNAVINTIIKGFPLNTMYWVKNDDGTFELLDGQQRTLSICMYLNGVFSLKDKEISNLPFFLNDKCFNFNSDKNTEMGQNLLNYELMVYICEEGSDKERLEWFQTINIAGEKLTDQELRNAVYTGAWLTDAKRKFSKTSCVAYKIGKDFIKGNTIRQDYLETAINWISKGNIEKYMGEHQHNENANELWLYFNNVIEWVKATFNTDKYYRKEMQGLDWGTLYEKYHNNSYNADELEKRITELMANEEVTEKKGVYEYVLSGEDEDLACKLSKRAFLERDKRTIYERQNGICPKCGKTHPYEEMEGDHIIPWWRGGKTTIDNLQMLCKKCNGKKSGKRE